MDRPYKTLSRREREIMDVLYTRGRATVAGVLEDIRDPPSYSAVRASLRILEEKGHVRHEKNGLRYVFIPRVRKSAARKSVIRNLVRTFFDGSREEAVAALLDDRSARLSEKELDRLVALIERARREGKA